MTEYNKNTEGAPSNTINDLPGLGYVEDDLKINLQEMAKSSIQDIVDIYSAQYRKARNTTLLPSNMWKPLRSEAYLICARHCEQLARELKKASKSPNMKL